MAISLETIVEEMLEYTKHLPGDKTVPEQILILKGHLLIERQLMALIECKSVQPKILKKSRLTFKNKLHLVEALYGEFPSIAWKQLHDLNSIRNSMAHELEDDLISKRLEKFIQSVEVEKILHVEGGSLERLAYCLSHIHLELVKARSK